MKENLEKELGRDVVIPDNSLDYKYIEQDDIKKIERVKED